MDSALGGTGGGCGDEEREDGDVGIARAGMDIIDGGRGEPWGDGGCIFLV